MKYLQCTTTNGTNFKIIDPRDDPKRPTAKVIKTIHVAGGANRRDAKSLATPNGACTEVSEEDYALLEQNHVFQEMVLSGAIVVSGDHHLDVTNNTKKDASAPKTPEDYKKSRANSSTPVPTTGSPESNE